MAAPAAPQQPEPIKDQYIVVFKPECTSEKRAAHRAWAAELHFEALSDEGHGGGATGLLHKFNMGNGHLAGYTARVTGSVIQKITETDEVEFVEQDYKVYPLQHIVQVPAPSWGLARLSSTAGVTSDTDGIYTYDDDAAGDGTTVYVIDTGILVDHDDFEGRAEFGYNAVANSSDTDLQGHGTHVSGTTAGRQYGVAKKANIVAVKVLGDDGSGTNSGVIAGIQWAVKNAQTRPGGIQKCVANMSLGGSFSQAVNRAVRFANDQGMTMVVAAGNETEDANTGSPASEPTAVTVGAIDENNTLAWFSDYGPRVDVFAPGVNITSCWIDESGGGATDQTKVLQGTSMASPHITGLCAYLISKDPSLNSPGKVVAKLKQLALKGQIISALKGSPNLVAFNGEVV